MIKINNLEELRTLENCRKLPKTFEHHGFIYELGNTSAWGMSSMLIDNKEGNIYYSCYDNNVPKENTAIKLCFKAEGVSIILDRIEYRISSWQD